jgi:Bacterial Ig domain
MGSIWPGARSLVAVVGVSVGLFAAASPASAQTGDVGHEGPSYSNTAGPLTAEKPESKLWWNDGFWWANMFDNGSGTYHIFRLDTSTQGWVDTGVRVDPRAGSRADVLWDGTKLYVASRAAPSRLYRFSYNAGADTYSLDAGFPVTITSVKPEALTIAKDSTGQLWATWTQGSPKQVYVNRTTGSDTSWGTPFVLPVAGTTVNGDDISAIVAFGGDSVGVMWSNQNDDNFYFAVHEDAEGDTTWEASVSALGGNNNADDHINLKAAADGRVFAAVKTSQGNLDATLNTLLVRNAATGGWSSHPFGRKRDHHTRPIVLLDEEAGRVHMFATVPEGNGRIYEKTAFLSNPTFPLGLGTLVIDDADNAKMNNATSTKQNLNATTGLVVLATNPVTERYWHHYDPLGGEPPPPPPPPTNTAPTATAGSASTTAGTPVGITLRGSDAEQCELSFAVTAQPTHGTLGSLGNASCTTGSPNRDTATVTYTPDAGYEGPDSFQFTVNDGSLTSGAATVSITVDAEPEPGSGISFVSASSAANAMAKTLTIPAPAAVTAGNVLLAAIDVRGGPAITAPAGWTFVRMDANGTVIRQAVYWKVATSAEPASYTWTFSASQAAAGGIAAFEGVDTANPIDAHGGQVNASSKSITAPSITTTVANAMVAGFFGTGPATTVTPPAGMTERWEAVSTAGTYKATSEAATALQASAGATGTRIATAANAGANVGQLVALRPA